MIGEMKYFFFTKYGIEDVVKKFPQYISLKKYYAARVERDFKHLIYYST